MGHAGAVKCQDRRSWAILAGFKAADFIIGGALVRAMMVWLALREARWSILPATAPVQYRRRASRPWFCLSLRNGRGVRVSILACRRGGRRGGSFRVLGSGKTRKSLPRFRFSIILVLASYGLFRYLLQAN